MKSEVTVAHDAIPGYMEAMAMQFRVSDKALLAGIEAGDLVRGRLIVRTEDAYLESLERTGKRALPQAPSVALSGTGSEFLLEGDTAPDVSFIDQYGRARRLYERKAVARVLTFIYTRCPFPTFCPLMDRQFRSVQERVKKNQSLNGRVELLSVTLDPDYDTPPVLRVHAVALGADPRIWNFVRLDGPSGAVLADQLGVIVRRESSESTVIVHNLVTVVIQPNGVIAKIYRGGEWTPQDVGDLLESLFRSTEATG